MKLRSKELKAAVYGMVLGDAFISRPNKAGNCRIQFCHSLKQKDYLLYKKKILENITGHTFKYYEDSFKCKDKVHKRCIVYSNPSKYFRKIRDIFYTKDNKKIVNIDILNKLTPMALALWWQDDGCLTLTGQKDYKGKFYKFLIPELASCNFSIEENELIKKYFLTKYGISTTLKIHKSNKTNSSSIYIKFYIEDFKNFAKIIEPFVIESLYYKIDTNKHHK